MVIPTLLAPSNSADGVALLRTLGFEGSEERERRANDAGDPTPYEFAHVVFGVRGTVPRPISTAEGLRCVREDAAVTWVGGTFAAWWRAIVAEDVAPAWRAGAASVLSSSTGLTPFGNPLFLAEPPKWLTVAPPPAPDTPAAEAWGGIVSVALDQQAEADFVKAGARVLRRSAIGAAPPSWARVADAEESSAGEAGRKGKGGGGLAPADSPVSGSVTIIGSLALPIGAEEIDARERQLLERFEAEYRKVMVGLKSAPALAALRLPFELSTLLVAVDGAAIKQCLAASHATTARVARALDALHRASCAGAATPTAAPAAKEKAEKGDKARKALAAPVVEAVA